MANRLFQASQITFHYFWASIGLNITLRFLSVHVIPEWHRDVETRTLPKPHHQQDSLFSPLSLLLKIVYWSHLAGCTEFRFKCYMIKIWSALNVHTTVNKFSKWGNHPKSVSDFTWQSVFQENVNSPKVEFLCLLATQYLYCTYTAEN